MNCGIYENIKWYHIICICTSGCCYQIGQTNKIRGLIGFGKLHFFFQHQTEQHCISKKGSHCYRTFVRIPNTVNSGIFLCIQRFWDKSMKKIHDIITGHDKIFSRNCNLSQTNTQEGWQDIVLRKLMDFFIQMPISKAYNDKKWKKLYFPGHFKVNLQLQNFPGRQSPNLLSGSYFEHWIDLNCNIWRQLNTPVLLTLELQTPIKRVPRRWICFALSPIVCLIALQKCEVDGCF